MVTPVFERRVRLFFFFFFLGERLPPPPSAVPLPRFAGEDRPERPSATRILPRLRGTGPMRSMVEGAPWPKILFWVASRGHHADVGGTAPGSMTPLATTVDEKGVLFDNFRLVEHGRSARRMANLLPTTPILPATPSRTSPT